MISKSSAAWVALAAFLLAAEEATAVEVWRGIPAADHAPAYVSRRALAINDGGSAESPKKEGGQNRWLLNRSMCGTLLVVAVVLATLGLLVQLPRWRELMCPADFALYANLMICVQGFTNYSSVVLCAFPLCSALGVAHAASVSGLFIGIFMTASAAGTGVAWKILNMYPDLWQNDIKTFFVTGLSCQLVAAAGLARVAWARRNGEVDVTWVSVLMLFRVLQGFGHGLNDQVMKCCIVKLAPVSDRPRHSLNKFVANTVGIGCGPLLVAAACVFFQDHDSNEPTTRAGSQISMLTAQLQFWTTATVLATTVLLYPSMQDVAAEHGKASTPVRGDQAVVLITSTLAVAAHGIIVDALRAFIVSGVESATCLLLQDRFGWNDGSIGFCIGLTFCLTVPVYLLHRQYHGRFQDISLLRVYTVVGMLAAILLGLAQHPLQILCADSVIFPTTYLAGALNMGILNSNVFPDGSLLDANNVMLINGLVSNGVGRFGGPVFSRSLIADLGQMYYAGCQGLAMASILAGTNLLAPSA